MKEFEEMRLKINFILRKKKGKNRINLKKRTRQIRIFKSKF